MRTEPPGNGETVADIGEFGLIRRVTTGRPQPAGTLLGPGDDAAALPAPAGRAGATTDALAQGLPPRLDWPTPDQAGPKATAVNRAAIAPMRAAPHGPH